VSDIQEMAEPDEDDDLPDTLNQAKSENPMQDFSVIDSPQRINRPGQL